MKNFNFKTSFVSPERLKARANKTGISFMIFILISVGNTMLYMIFLYGSIQVIIQRILIGLEAISKRFSYSYEKLRILNLKVMDKTLLGSMNDFLSLQTIILIKLGVAFF